MTYATLSTAAAAARPSRTETAAIGAAGGGVRALLRAEGLALAAAATAAYAHAGFSWGLFAALFLAPDLSFAAYWLGPKWGAAAYDLVHSTIAPLALGVVGARARRAALPGDRADRSRAYRLRPGVGIRPQIFRRLRRHASGKICSRAR